MRQQRRYVGALVLAGITVGGLSACSPDKNFKDDSAIPEKITSVRLDSTTGSVTLHGRAGADTVSVHRSVDYSGDKPGTTVTVENGALVLHGCGRHCSVGYTVELPAGLPISGQTSNGAISLSQVGQVNVSTTNGGITLDGVAGPAEVRTTNGAIKGTGLNGDHVQAETSNGRIDLTPVRAQDVKAKTSNGGIALTVPADAYKVSADTDNGSKNIGVGNDPNGRYRLDLRTSNGGITVRTS
ncbi:MULTISPECIES: DUF4097 family beta strand repeat-containing protein [unclassified Kitasatospora]|uniref:DUF4097 family beta strand repeat-containing protein n=1 Tax=unclassified Kitasatospora TaxID=2633591 RepID=UPI00382EA493